MQNQVCQTHKKNTPLCFLYISASIKAAEIFFIWEDRGDPTVSFEYKTDSDRYSVANFLKQTDTNISMFVIPILILIH